MAFYPADAPVPTELRTAEFLLRPLRATDVDLDYEAVMAAQEDLRRISGGTWPRPDFTRAENLADLQQHEADFRARRGFTYTVMNPAETRCLGCVYAYPPKDDSGSESAGDFAAEVWFWVRPDGVAADLERRLLAAVAPWLRDEFAFARVLIRAQADDARQTAILRELGLRVVDTRKVRNVERLLFE
jgi:hypothetical protein